MEASSWAALPSEEGKVEFEDEDEAAAAAAALLLEPPRSWREEEEEEEEAEGVAGGSEWSDHMLVGNQPSGRRPDGIRNGPTRCSSRCDSYCMAVSVSAGTHPPKNGVYFSGSLLSLAVGPLKPLLFLLICRAGIHGTDDLLEKDWRLGDNKRWEFNHPL